MKSNFTPMNKFNKILDLYGLKSFDVRPNHIRVFYNNKKIFDYFPLRMKLFDYKEWHQLTYPFTNGKKYEWENEIIMIINKILKNEKV